MTTATSRRVGIATLVGGIALGAVACAPPANKVWNPVPSAPIISNFGYRTHPSYGTTRFHAGVDMPAKTGTPIRAAHAGTVTQAGYSGGYGNYTCIVRDGNRSFSTCYAHQSQIFVRSGQHVAAGQHIGAVGSTGVSTGPHLHFEVKINGVPQNPRNYL